MLSGCILTIDDEDLLRQSIAAYLEDSGYRVLQASNGEEGLKIVEQHRPDVVLSDLQMPVMGGLEVLGVITVRYPDIPVIVVSGAGNMNDAIEALRLGAWDYLVKPITDMAVLEHAIIKSMERSRLKIENTAYRRELETQNDALQKSLAELKEDQEAGRRVQFRLLPAQSHTIGEYKISYQVNPSLYLSGDFVDYFPIDKNRFGFYIADVSGHGAASAFVTVLLKNLIEAILARYNKDDTILNPSKVLKEISDEILSAKLGKYLTMIYCVLNHKTNTLTYSVGGHYPGPILNTAGKSEFINGEGFAVGIFDKAQFTDNKLKLPKEFNLAMFSDGLLEILGGDNLDDSEQKLLGLVQSETKSAKNIARTLGLEYEGIESLPDDIAMLVLSRGGQDAD